MVIAYSRLKTKYNQLNSSSKKIIQENKSFKEDNDKRIARYKTTGWYKNSEKDDPNKYTWDVYIDLRKVSTSDNRKKSKFEVISITSGNVKDIQDCSEGSFYFEFYKDHFLKKTGDGWLSNSDVEWVIDLPKEALRDKKLKDLGIE
jgi:hypothetical protein